MSLAGWDATIAALREFSGGVGGEWDGDCDLVACDGRVLDGE